MKQYYNLKYITRMTVYGPEISKSNDHIIFKDNKWYYLYDYYVNDEPSYGSYSKRRKRTEKEVNINSYISSTQFIDDNKIYENPRVRIKIDGSDLFFSFKTVELCVLLVDVINNRSFGSLTISFDDLVEDIQKHKTANSYLRSKKLTNLLK